VILIGLFSSIVELAGLGALVLGTVLAAPGTRRYGLGWWLLLAGGCGLAGIGAAVSLLSDGVGGLLAVLGAATALTGAVLGFPGRSQTTDPYSRTRG
jgi:hypothetical protein